MKTVSPLRCVMFEFVVVVVLANLLMLAALYLLRHVIAIRAPVLLMAVGISILYCILYPFLSAQFAYPQVVYLYVFLVIAGACTLYFVENRFFAVGEVNENEYTSMTVAEAVAAMESSHAAVSGSLPPAHWRAAGGAPSGYKEPSAIAAAKSGLSGEDEEIVVQEDTGALSYPDRDVRDAIAAHCGDDVKPEDTGADAAFPESGHIVEETTGDIYIEEPDAQYAAAGQEPGEPLEDIPDLGFKDKAGYVSDDEVAVLLSAAAGHSQDATDQPADAVGGEMAATPGPVDVPCVMDEGARQVEDVTVAMVGEPGEPAGDIDMGGSLPGEEMPVGACPDDQLTATTAPEAVVPPSETGGEAIPTVETDVPALAGELPEEGIYIEEFLPLEDLAGIEEAAVLTEEALPEQLYLPWAESDEIAWAAGVSDDADEEDSEKDAVLAVSEETHRDVTASGVVPAVAAEDDALPAESDINSLVAGAFDRLALGDSAGAVDNFFKALKLGPPPRLAVLLCTRISSLYTAQGRSRQALAVMEMLEVVWGPMLDESDMKGVKTIIIQLRGEL
jgi:hypothetical protein